MAEQGRAVAVTRVGSVIGRVPMGAMAELDDAPRAHIFSCSRSSGGIPREFAGIVPSVGVAPKRTLKDDHY